MSDNLRKKAEEFDRAWRAGDLRAKEALKAAADMLFPDREREPLFRAIHLADSSDGKPEVLADFWDLPRAIAWLEIVIKAKGGSGGIVDFTSGATSAVAGKRKMPEAKKIFTAYLDRVMKVQLRPDERSEFDSSDPRLPSLPGPGFHDP